MGKSKVGRMSAGARRVIGATAKPLYPIDGKAAGLDRRIPQDLPLRGRGTAAAVEGVCPPYGRALRARSSPGLDNRLREDARRVIGATAKPLYPIDVKAAGLDRRIPQDLPLRGRGTAAAVEGVRPRGCIRGFERTPEGFLRATGKPLG